MLEMRRFGIGAPTLARIWLTIRARTIFRGKNQGIPQISGLCCFVVTPLSDLISSRRKTETDVRFVPAT